MRVENIGTDVVSIGRLRKALLAKKLNFFAANFTNMERTYCFSYKDPAPHFAGTFAAKEAVQKALGARSIRDIEIRRDKSGRPSAWSRGKRANVRLSITHERSVAFAVALALS